MNTHDEHPRIEAQRLVASAGFPNNPVLPLLVYRQAIPAEARPRPRSRAADGPLFEHWTRSSG